MEQNALSTVQALLELSCRAGDKVALRELTSSPNPIVHNCISDLYPMLLLVASERGHIGILDILRDTRTVLPCRNIGRTLGQIANASVARYKVDNKHATATAVYCWWLNNSNIPHDDLGQALSLVIVWAAAIDSVQGMSAIVRVHRDVLPAILNDEESRSKIFTAVTLSHKFIEFCEILGSSKHRSDYLPTLLVGRIEDTLSKAVTRHEIKQLCYLVNRLQLRDNAALLSHPFKLAVAANNLSAALFLRSQGALPPTQRPKGVDATITGAEGWKQKAIIVLFDIAWEAKRRYQRAEMMRAFVQAEEEIQKALAEVEWKIAHVRALKPAVGMKYAASSWPSDDYFENLYPDLFPVLRQELRGGGESSRDAAGIDGVNDQYGIQPSHNTDPKSRGLEPV